MAAENTLPNVEEAEMTVWDHIGELRKRLIWGLGAMIITTVASVYLATYIIDFMAQPIGGIGNLYATEVTENISMYMRVSMLAGFIMALPIIVYEILAFVVPGLYDNEKRWVFSAIPIATLLFVGGVAFSYYIMLPTALPFLLNVLSLNGEGVKTLTRISSYISFVTNMMFWIGMSFETPLLVFILAKFRVVTAAFLLKQWRFALVIIAIMAAVITPTPDPINMSLMMAPLFAIYMLSILFAVIAVGGTKRSDD